MDRLVIIQIHKISVKTIQLFGFIESLNNFRSIRYVDNLNKFKFSPLNIVTTEGIKAPTQWKKSQRPKLNLNWELKIPVH